MIEHMTHMMPISMMPIMICIWKMNGSLEEEHLLRDHQASQTTRKPWWINQASCLEKKYHPIEYRRSYRQTETKSGGKKDKKKDKEME